MPPTWIPDEGTPDPALPRTMHWTFAVNDAGQGALTRLGVRFGQYELMAHARPEDAGDMSLSLSDASLIFEGVATGTLLYPFDARRRVDGDEAAGRDRLRARQSNARRAARLLREAGNDFLIFRRFGLLPSGLTPSMHLAASVGERDRGIVNSYLNRTAQLVVGVSHECDQLLDALVWLGPLRSAPQRVYDRADVASAMPGGGRQVALYLFDHASVVQQVDDWLKRLEIPYTLDVVPVSAGNTAQLVGDLVVIVLTDGRSGVQVTPADVGFGVSQVLPIVVELLSRRESIIAIEQPETHLHPRLQARLADLFIDTVQQGGRGNQLIVETHSEHIMLRVQRRIREGLLDPSSVSVVYVDQEGSEPASVKPLRLNQQGDLLDDWPHGFFDERLEELFGGL